MLHVCVAWPALFTCLRFISAAMAAGRYGYVVKRSVADTTRPPVEDSAPGHITLPATPAHKGRMSLLGFLI
jgi:hypothetical protein